MDSVGLIPTETGTEVAGSDARMEPRGGKTAGMELIIEERPQVFRQLGKNYESDTSP